MRVLTNSIGFVYYPLCYIIAIYSLLVLQAMDMKRRCANGNSGSGIAANRLGITEQLNNQTK